ncbi:MAG: MFS transporter [Acidobacteriaceae bacterium]|nr:MFS transporter [Acidobacteriaceae bacterium]
MQSEHSRPHWLHWLALGLLVLSVGINYIDRGNLGVAASSIERDLHFPPDKLGLLSTAFFLTYSLFAIVSGKILDHWNVNWVYAAAFLLWSATTGLTGLATSFSLFLALRALLGIGESVAYPAYSKIISSTFPERLRGTANAAIDAGSKVGPALGVSLCFKLIVWHSWRFMFMVIGGASLLWLIPWCLLVPKLTQHGVRKSSAWAPAYAELVKKRALWGTILGLFGGNYTWYLFLTWLPYYFEHERHYTKDRLAVVASLPFWSVALSSMLCGLLADALIRRGYRPGKVRQTFIASGLSICCFCMIPAFLVAQEWASVLFFVLACFAMGGFSSNHWALSQLLSGPEAAGKWTGFQNCCGNFAGVVAPYLSGLVLRETHSFVFSFIIACVVLLLGVLGYTLVVGDPVPLVWRESPLSLHTNNDSEIIASSAPIYKIDTSKE